MGDCIVIGAGLAGSAVAASLARRGWDVHVVDAAAEPAQGASALPAGLMAPHHSADDNLLSQLSRVGVALTLGEARALLVEGRDWAPCGALEHRVGKTTLPPPSAHGPVPASLAQRRAAQLPDAAVALWHESAAWVRPASLVRAWLSHPSIRFEGGIRVRAIERVGDRWQVAQDNGAPLRAGLVVIAAAIGSGPLAGGTLPLHPVRGQVSGYLHPPDVDLPAFALNGNGHFIPQVPHPDGMGWYSGSTYDRGDDDATPRESDHASNLDRLRVLVPAIADRLAPDFEARRVRGWAGVRCASTDRRPIVGELAPGLFASTAMGSRGLTFCMLAAQLVAAQAAGEPCPLPDPLAKALSPNRFGPRAR